MKTTDRPYSNGETWNWKTGHTSRGFFGIGADRVTLGVPEEGRYSEITASRFKDEGRGKGTFIKVKHQLGKQTVWEWMAIKKPFGRGVNHPSGSRADILDDSWDRWSGHPYNMSHTSTISYDLETAEPLGVERVSRDIRK